MMWCTIGGAIPPARFHLLLNHLNISQPVSSPAPHTKQIYNPVRPCFVSSTSPAMSTSSNALDFVLSVYNANSLSLEQ